MKDSYHVMKLREKRTYPTYQLHAFISNNRLNPEDGLRLAALTTLQWVKIRLSDAAPEEWNIIPPPEKFMEADNSCLMPISFNQGYEVRSVYLPEKNVWALQFNESDSGLEARDGKLGRAPVQGRTIETNIAFRIVGEKVECGFQTLVSDPVETESEAEVLRLAVVRELMKNPDFGLTQVIPLSMGYDRIRDESGMKAAMRVLRNPENQIPTVLFSQPVTKETVTEVEVQNGGRPRRKPSPTFVLPEQEQSKKTAAFQEYMRNAGSGRSKQKEKKEGPGKDLAAGLKNASAMLKDPVMSFPSVKLAKKETVKFVASEPRYDLALFTHHVYTHCRTFVLEREAEKAFEIQTGCRLSNGAVAVLYPSSMGGEVRILDQGAEEPDDAFVDSLEAELKNYLRGQPIDFGDVLFLADVREDLLYASRNAKQDAEEAFAGHRLKLEEQINRLQDELARMDSQIYELKEKNRKLSEAIAKLGEEKSELREKHDKELEEQNAIIRDKEKIIDYRRFEKDFPKHYADIAEWVELNLSGRLILHSKAVRLLESSTSNKQISAKLICSALTYLATEYWEIRYQQLPEDEANRRCSDKYGRPFTVTPVGLSTIAHTPSEYKIKYFRNEKGKLKESGLDYHLKVGNRSDNLLRIYFLHDDEERLIVVGSLPEHLTNFKYKA